MNKEKIGIAQTNQPGIRCDVSGTLMVTIPEYQKMLADGVQMKVKEFEDYIADKYISKERVREVVESMKKTVKDLHPEATLSTLDEDTAFFVIEKDGYNKALNDILATLTKDNEK